ncbi:MAG: DUF58 domain-containing protein [Acidobacteriota bacterium]
MPSGRLFALLALPTVLAVGVVVQPALLWVVLLLDALLLVAFVVDRRRAAALPLEARRSWPTMLVQGAADRLKVAITNSSQRPVRLRAREGLSPSLAWEPAQVRLRIAPQATARWTAKLLPRQRGMARVAPLAVRVLGPWGLAWSRRDLLPSEQLRVYPQIRWEGRVGQLLTRAQRHQLGATPLARKGGSGEPYALREYLPGDPPNTIHWKASARHGTLVTREDTWERGARLVILLDCSRSMLGRAETDAEIQAAAHALELQALAQDAGTADAPVSEGSGGSAARGLPRVPVRSKLDHALAAALALTRVAAARGDRVTLLAFSDRVEKEVRVAGGSRGLSRAYSSLFDLQARRVEPAYDLSAQRLMELESRSATVVLMTSVIDLAAAEMLKDTLRRLERRHRPILVNLEDPELLELVHGEPATEAQAFAQVTGLEIQLENRRLSRRLRRAGIRALNVPAQNLALETLETYLSLFRGQLRRAG